MNVIHAKAEKMTKKLNKIANTLQKQVPEAKVDSIEPTEVVEYIENKTPIIASSSSMPVVADQDTKIDVKHMFDDFDYIRKTIYENTECSRSLMELVAGNLLDEDSEATPGMIAAFADLNRTVMENMKLCIQSYKDLSTIMNNINASTSKPEHVTNNVNFIGSDAVIANVNEIIDKLRKNN